MLHTTRRRFLAMLSLTVAGVPLAARAQFATHTTEMPPPEGITGDPSAPVVRDYGNWHVVSIANVSNATLLPAATRVASGSRDGIRGSADLKLEYFSGNSSYAGKLSIGQNGSLLGGSETRVVIDGREVDAFTTAGSEDRDLATYFGENLAGLTTASNLKVVFTANDLVVYDIDLTGAADAMAAMKAIPDYNYNVRGLGNPSAGAPSGFSAPSSSGSGQGSCFITTACCTMIGLPDDCAELTTLRHFRDTVMAKSPEGRRDIARYYATAPAILAEIARRGAERDLLRLYFRYIVPSALAARLGLNALAWWTYRRMMQAMTARYLGALPG
ncbi:MAG: CFI-box-CTERM domain-containing protein [Bauldia sp.]